MQTIGNCNNGKAINYNLTQWTTRTVDAPCIRHWKPNIVKEYCSMSKKSFLCLFCDSLHKDGHDFLGMQYMGTILGAPEITANLYCNFVHLYWEGYVICCIYLR